MISPGEIQPTEIEIIHRIGQKKTANRDQEQGSSNDRKRLRPTIVKFLSHKSKTREHQGDREGNAQSSLWDM